MDDVTHEGTDSTPSEHEEFEYDDSRWPEWAHPFLDVYKRGTPNVGRAADRIGKHRRTIYKLAERDEAFKLAMRDAFEDALDFLQDQYYAASTGGLPYKKKVTTTEDGKVTKVVETDDVFHFMQGGLRYLERYRPEWKTAYRVEQTGAGGGPIQHEVKLVEDLAREARGDLDRLQRDLLTPLNADDPAGLPTP